MDTLEQDGFSWGSFDAIEVAHCLFNAVQFVDITNWFYGDGVIWIVVEQFSMVEHSCGQEDSVEQVEWLTIGGPIKEEYAHVQVSAMHLKRHMS